MKTILRGFVTICDLILLRFGIVAGLKLMVADPSGGSSLLPMVAGLFVMGLSIGICGLIFVLVWNID
jgi:hypothetical protein